MREKDDEAFQFGDQGTIHVVLLGFQFLIGGNTMALSIGGMCGRDPSLPILGSHLLVPLGESGYLMGCRDKCLCMVPPYREMSDKGLIVHCLREKGSKIETERSTS